MTLYALLYKLFFSTLAKIKQKYWKDFNVEKKNQILMNLAYEKPYS